MNKTDLHPVPPSAALPETHSVASKADHEVVAVDLGLSGDELMESELLALESELAVLEYAETPRDALRSRLLGNVATLPTRYAPFYGRAARLFEVSEAQVEQQFARMADATAWQFSGWPGIRNIVVQAGPNLAAAETLFARFAPGVHLPRHEHTGEELVLVLEGGYVDNTGAEFRAGQWHHMPVGSEHSIRAMDETGCVFASVVHGRRFKAWPLRVLSALIGR